MKRRILQIIPSLDRSGAEKQLTLLACGLPRDEFEVHVCALTRGGPMRDPLRAAEIPVTVIGKRWRVDPRAYWKLRRHIARLAPELVHTWLFAANSYGRLAARACGVRSLVAAERCVDSWKGGTELSVDRFLARHTARIVVNSPAVRAFYVGRGLPEAKLLVIPNGVAPPPVAAGNRQQLLAELGLPEGARLVALVGRLWPQKRVKDAIWAADLLKVIRDDVYLLLVGEGPLRERLLRYRDQVQIRDKVRFLGERSDVPRILPHLAALWSTSSFEGQSNTIMEAMAAGVPVVATDIPGTRDLVEHDRTGYLFPVGDRAALARYTQRLLENDELARRLGGTGRQRMAAQFTVEQMVARHAELYRELLAERSPAQTARGTGR